MCGCSPVSASPGSPPSTTPASCRSMRERASMSWTSHSTPTVDPFDGFQSIFMDDLQLGLQAGVSGASEAMGASDTGEWTRLGAKLTISSYQGLNRPVWHHSRAAARLWWSRRLDSPAVEKPAHWRMVQGCLVYIAGYRGQAGFRH